MDSYKSNYDPNKPMQVGGQAVLEGVMMRAPGSVATAVRRANGQIVVQQQSYKSVTEKYKWLNIPILRGAVGLIDMMYLGMKTLNFSAEIAMLDVETKETKQWQTDTKNKVKPRLNPSWLLLQHLYLHSLLE